MAAVPKRVAAHIIRKPAVESAVCEVIEAAGETSRVDLRELQHMLANTSAPIDLETDIEVCAEPAEAAANTRSTRLAHTVRRNEPIVEGLQPLEIKPAATVEMPVMQMKIAQAAAAAEPTSAPAALPVRDRATIYAAAAFIAAAICLVVVVVAM